jgi:mono/diheme cytochrome c family protein
MLSELGEPPSEIRNGTVLMRSRISIRSRLKRLLPFVVGALVVVAIAIQFVPYGRPGPNPPTSREPRWDSPRTRELAARACFDCHSNNTQYPWYSYVAPVSWLVKSDVDEAHTKLNFSEWDGVQREAGEAAEKVEKGEMPLWYYVPLHPDARLSAEEKQALIDGLRATINADRPRRR